MSFEKTWSSMFYASASPEERLRFKAWLTGILREGRMNIEFIKVDGTKRLMHCTLKSDLIPQVIVETVEDETAAPKTPRKQNDEIIRVWDLEKEGWRSIKLETINSFSFNLGD